MWVSRQVYVQWVSVVLFLSRPPTTCASIRMTAEIFEFWLKLCLLVAATELMATTSGYSVIDSV